MKILVCISKTPDTTAKIAFANNNTTFSGDGVQWIINPYDEWYSLVRAIELKEKDASAAIHECVLAIKAHVTVDVLADTIHAFPSTSRILNGLFAEAKGRLGSA